MINVLICDDQSIVCEGLTKILGSDPELFVVGVARDGEEAIEKALAFAPDIVLMDLKMPIKNGILATREIREKLPGTPILILTTYDDDEWIFDAIHSGAAGYLLKDTPPAELIAAIKGTVKNKTYIDPNIAGKLLKQVLKQPSTTMESGQFNLNEREEELLRLLASGASNNEIAQQLFLTEGTVRNYISDLFKKLGVSDRTQAVVIGFRYGLIDLRDI